MEGVFAPFHVSAPKIALSVLNCQRKNAAREEFVPHMKCLIIAAGRGSRLSCRGPSKPLVPLLGMPLIETDNSYGSQKWTDRSLRGDGLSRRDGFGPSWTS